MAIQDTLGSLLNDDSSPDEVNAAYAQVSRSVPQSSLADGLAHAFNSDKTPPFEQMLGGLFGNSNPNQKAGLLNEILGSLGGGQAGGLLASLGLGGAAAGAGQRITPEQAEQISPDTVESMAKNAARKDPSIVDKAAGFYAQHPQLVQTIGVGALALLMSKVSQRRA